MQTDYAKAITLNVLTYLNEHIGIDSSIGLVHVKKALGITNKDKLNNACKQTLGVSSQELIIHLKMIKAYYFYHQENLTEQTIADRLCYSDPQSLCKAFNNYTHGQTLKSCQMEYLNTELQFKLKSLIDSDKETKEFFLLNLIDARK